MIRIRYLIPAAGTILALASLAASPPASATAVAANGNLYGVACAAGGTSCVAVGSYENASGDHVALAETSSGTTWKQVTFPLPHGATSGTLEGVACTSSKACTAVGEAYIGTYPKGHEETLAGRWDGSSWKLQSIATPSGDSPALLAVSCLSSDSCMAVGNTETSAFAESWNGHAWSLKSMPLPSGADAPDVSGVSCAGSDCTAVGIVFDRSISDYDLATAWRWSGSHWAVTYLPNPASATEGAQPIHDACSGASACTAVGLYGSAAGFYPYVVSLSGTKWKLQSAPPPSGSTNSELRGIACPSASDCVATGTSKSSVSFAELWNGHTWSVRSSPAPKGATFIEIAGASCNSKASCTSVGYYLVSTTYLAFAEHWNGSKWSLQHPVNP